jgi:hypothetical protein
MPHKEPHSIYSRKILNKNSICDDPLRRNEKAQVVFFDENYSQRCLTSLPYRLL